MQANNNTRVNIFGIAVPTVNETEERRLQIRRDRYAPRCKARQIAAENNWHPANAKQLYHTMLEQTREARHAI